MTRVGSGSGWFRASVNRVAGLCTSLNLAIWHNPLPRYPTDMASNARKLRYSQEWDMYQSGSLFDILLADGALLQFKEQPNDKSVLSYSYLECPYVAKSYSEFVMEIFGVADPDFKFWEEYESYVVQCEIRDSVTPVRYDYSPSLYREGIHPASHLHMGHRTEVRLSCKRVLRPLSFFLFILRQYYPVVWENGILCHRDANSLVRQVRDDIDAVHVKMFKSKDLWEQYLA